MTPTPFPVRENSLANMINQSNRNVSGAKTLANLFLAFVFFWVHGTGLAGQAVDEKKAEASLQPCFKLLKREWPQVESGNYPVCRDFLKSLNSFCDEPPPTCERKIHPKSKRLALPKWEELDPKEYLKVIEQMLNDNYENTQVWNPIPPITVENINHGKAHLWHAWVDLDHDGKREHVLRFDEGGCNPIPPHRRGFYGFNYRMSVVDERISRVDSRYNYVQTTRDVLLHDGRAYVLRYFAGDDDTFSLQEPFHVSETGGRDAISVCEFQYLK